MRIVEEWRLKPVSEENEIGIEIEVEGSNIPQAPSGWTGVSDGSLRGESLEYVLSRPVPRNKVEGFLNDLSDQFTKNRTRLNLSDRCGIHVHVNCQNLTTPQVINFTLLYLLLEDFLTHWCGPTREGNLFCLRGKDAEFLYSGLYKAKIENSLHILQKDQYRYAGVNLTSIHKYGSVEFRTLKTTNDFRTRTVSWVDILTNIKDKSLSFDSSRDMIEEMKKDLLGFAGDALKTSATAILSELDNPILHLKEAMWRIQDIAYAEINKNKVFSKRNYSQNSSEFTQNTVPASWAIPPGFSENLIIRPASSDRLNENDAGDLQTFTEGLILSSDDPDGDI